MGAQIYMTEREYRSVAYCVDYVRNSIQCFDNDDCVRKAKLAAAFATDVLNKYIKNKYL